MPTLDNFHENHGDPSKWAQLNGEETRCLLGLKSYYVRVVDKSEQEALELAWVDLQTEHKRLLEFLWFQQNKED